jgi:hypothetical protein
MTDVAIRVENLSKRYKTQRAALTAMLTAPCLFARPSSTGGDAPRSRRGRVAGQICLSRPSDRNARQAVNDVVVTPARRHCAATAPIALTLVSRLPLLNPIPVV